MKLYRLIVILILSIPLQVFNQETFSKLIDVHQGDVGISICQTNDSGYIITGICNDGTNHDDIVLLRTNEYGDTLWSKTFGFQEFDDVGVCVKETNDLGYVIAGTFQVHYTPPHSAVIIKTDSFGDTLWMDSYGPDSYGYYVLQTPDSGFALFGQNIQGAFLRKYDNDGNILWDNTYGGDYGKFVTAQLVEDNNMVVVGISDFPPCPFCTTIDLLKLNEYGDVIWSNRFGEDNSYAFTAYDIIQTNNGGFLISGGFSYPNVEQIPYILKVDSDGSFEWDKTYAYEYGHDIESVVQQDDSSYVFLSNRIFYNPYFHELVLVKIDIEGNIVWDKGYNCDSVGTAGYCLVETIDNYLVAVGNTWVASPDIFLIKTDSDGLITRIDNHNGETVWDNVSAYPNPFTTTATIEYKLTEPSRVQLTIYNAIGEVVYHTEDRLVFVGKHSFVWTADRLPEGLYYAVLKSEEGIGVVKMIKQ